MVAAAPKPLRRRAAKALLDPDIGLMLEMRKGPDVYFGTAEHLHDKWRAAARVLADPTAEGATYVDVRVPERAAAGGLAPLSEPTAQGEDPANAADSTSTGGSPNG
jgi:cell division protein FtsQ